MQDDDIPPIPEPNFLFLLQYPRRTEITKLFSKVGGDGKLGSFVKQGEKANLPETIGQTSVNTLHGALQAIGRHYGELLLAAGQKLDVTDEQEFLRIMALQEHPANVTLYFGKRADPTHLPIPNRMQDSKVTLDETLYLLGKASSAVKGRNQKNYGFISKRLARQGIDGQASVLLEQMGIVYRHIYQSLRDQRMGEEKIQHMMKESGLDIDQNALKKMLENIGREYPLPK